MKKRLLATILFICVILSGMTQLAAASSGTPAAPVGVVLNTGSETVSGVSNQMEYSTNGTRWIAISGTSLSITHMIPAATARTSATLSIRFKAANGQPASTAASIVLPRRPAAPSTSAVRLNGFTETISATGLMEYRAGTSGAFTAVPDGATSIPVTFSSSAQRYQVRIKATETAFASAVRTVSVPARRAAPNAVYNGSTDTITGVSNSMEYSLNNGTSWTSVTGTNIPRRIFGEAAITVMVRIKATLSAPSSNIKSVSVPGVATTYPTGPILDTRSETVGGVSNQMEYSTNGTRWTAISGNTLNISSLIPAATASSNVALSIRMKAANGQPASLATVIALPRRPATPTAANAAFDGFSESITLNDSMEYRLGSTGAFTAVPAGTTSIPANIGVSAQSYQVRIKATDATFASALRTISVPARRVAPNALYNGSADAITGVNNSMEYSLDNGAAWTPITASILTRSAFGDSSVTVLIRLKATAAVPVSGVKSVSVPNVSTTSPDGFYLDKRSETVSGVSPIMEYSLDRIKWTAISADTLNITSLIPSAAASSDATLYIRASALNGEPASLPASIALPRRPATPNAEDVSFDGFSESITVTDMMEYRLGATGEFMAVPAGATGIPANIGSTSQSYQVRLKATDLAFASAARTVSAPSRTTAPNAAYNGYVITGVSDAMEYSINDGATWNSIIGTSIPQSEFGDATLVLVRIRATAAAPSSNIRNVEISNAGSAAPTGVALDTRSETVTGLSELMEYSINGTSWSSATSEPLSIGGVISSANDVTLIIRYKAVNGEPASMAAFVTIPQRPAGPPAEASMFDGLTESIITSDLIEYRTSTADDYTAVPVGETHIPVNVSASSHGYQLRFKATDMAFASAPRTVTVPARPAAPTALYNGSTIIGVTNAIEFSVDGGAAWVTVSGTSISQSEFAGASGAVLVRTRATTSLPSSEIRSVAVPSDGDVFPTGIVLEMQSETLTGVTTLMEYSTNETVWTAITGDSLSLSYLISDTNDVILSVRYKETDDEPASFAVSILLPHRPAAPTTSAVRFDGFTETIMASSLMEYRTGTTGGYTAVASGVTRITVTVGSTSQSYQVRIKATETAFASAVRTVTVPARATAPSAAYNSSTDRIIGVSSAMEYSLNDGTTWISVSGTAILRSAIGSDAKTVMVRTRATSSTPASNIRNVTVPKAN